MLAIAGADEADASPQIYTAGIADAAVTPEKLYYPWSHRAFYGAQAAGNVVLDATIDWRNRFITAQGILLWQGNLAGAEQYIPGGSTDENLYGSVYYDRVGAALEYGQPSIANAQANLHAGFMYTEDGGANQTVVPRIFGNVDPGPVLFSIWVNSANGSLNLYMENGGGTLDFTAYNLIIGFGPAI
jgi:hypothetical protein